jgi:polyhydroxyalkanoate synthase
VVPEAIRVVSEHAGGRPVHVIGWSLGGIFATLVAADGPELPIASLTVVGSPVDVTKVPLVAPVRPLLNLTQGKGAITRAYRLLGGVPTPLVNWAFTAASAQKVVTKPLAVLTHLDDTDYLAQMEAVTRFMSNMTAYPGRTFGQLYHRFVKGNALATGRMPLGDRTVDLADITVPVLVFAGNTDGIAPLPAVRAVVPLLTGSRQVRFEVVPGGHLGMLTGRAARGTTWQAIDEWVAEWSAGVVPVEKAAATKKPAAARKAPAKKAAARKVPAKTTTKTTTKTAARKTPAKKTASKASAGTIGSNPTRRYGSAGSRALGR